MKKTIHIIPFDETEDRDIKYWEKSTPEQRLDALQVLREQYIYFFNKQNLYNESRKGLRRICKITKRA
jgi:hypothetical protein